MSSKLKYVINYILDKDDDHSLFLHEVINTLYLLDWKSALIRDGETISKVKWRIHELPVPASDDFWRALSSKNFVIERPSEDETAWIIRRVTPLKSAEISPEEKSVIDFVIKYVRDSKLKSSDLVSMTYPVVTNVDEENRKIDLKTMAKEYINNVRPELN